MAVSSSPNVLSRNQWTHVYFHKMARPENEISSSHPPGKGQSPHAALLGQAQRCVYQFTGEIMLNHGLLTLMPASLLAAAFRAINSNPLARALFSRAWSRARPTVRFGPFI